MSAGINLGLPWFACATLAGQETTAALHLRRQHHWVFLPMATHQKPGGGRLYRPRFPGYVLLQLDLNAPGWARVNSTRGVRHLLPIHLERPVALPKGFVEALMAKPDDEHVLIEYGQDEVVRLLVGPLAGILAHVESQDEDRLHVRSGGLMIRTRTSDVERA